MLGLKLAEADASEGFGKAPGFQSVGYSPQTRC